MRFKQFIAEEKYNIPLANEDDVNAFNTSLNKKDIIGAIDIVSKHVDDVPIAGGDGGSIKLRINVGSISDDIKNQIKKEIKQKYPKLKFALGQGSLGKKAGGIDWTTESMETCQCLGAFIDGHALLDDFGKADPAKLEALSKKWRKEVESALSNGEDWDRKGAQQVKTIVGSGMTLDRWIDIGTLAAGMRTFINDVASWKKLHIIHGSIGDYYAAEEKNQTILGTKANTADMIISSVPAKDLIRLIATEKAEFDQKGVCKIGNVQFLQVSLKKGKGGAQLGKITSNIKDKYNISDYSTILHNVIGEGFVEYQLDEGILQRSLQAVKNIATSVVGKLQNFFKKVTTFASNFLRGLSRQYNQQLKKDMAVFKRLREDVLTESKINAELRNLMPHHIAKLEAGINDRVKTLVSTGSRLSYVHCKVPTRKINTTNMQQDDKIKLFANYTTLAVLDNMLKASGRSASVLANDLVGLSKEMLFGKTQLPVYKVYGGTGKTYEFLGSGKQFMNKNSKFTEDTVLMGIRMDLPTTGSDKYYVIYSAFVLGVDGNGNPKYAENRMGTNRAGAFSYVIEGTKEMSVEEFEKYYA